MNGEVGLLLALASTMLPSALPSSSSSPVTTSFAVAIPLFNKLFRIYLCGYLPPIPCLAGLLGPFEALPARGTSAESW